MGDGVIKVQGEWWEGWVWGDELGLGKVFFLETRQEWALYS